MTRSKSAHFARLRGFLTMRKAGSKTAGEKWSSVFRAEARVGEPRRPLRIEDLEDRRLLAVDVPPLLDINTNPGQFFESVRSQIQVGPLLFFTAKSSTGDQLWKTNGFEWGTSLVKSFASVSLQDGFQRQNAANVNGTLYFTANDGASGSELWKTDGTESGTVRVKDIFAGTLGSSPTELINVAGTLYFIANDGISGRELWKSNGTPEGTFIQRDIWPGYPGSNPRNLTHVSGILYFSAENRSLGRELWKTNGTTAGTVLVRDIQVGTGASYPEGLTNVGGTLFFSAFASGSGRELSKSSGTVETTTQVAEIRSGGANSDPQSLTNVSGVLYFSADDGVVGRELWRSSGTALGTVRIKDIAPTGSSYPAYFTNHNGILYFIANDGSSGQELWRSDGTLAGTTLVKDIFQGSDGSNPGDNTLAAGEIFFRARSLGAGDELWKSDGTSVGTMIVKDIAPGIDHSWPGLWDGFSELNGAIYFRASSSSSTWSLWKSDGTEDGTVELLPDTEPRRLRRVGGSLYFFDSNSVFTRSDGTPQGTVPIKEFFGLGIEGIANVGNTMYFVANDGSSFGLWKSDGTVSGTGRLIDTPQVLSFLTLTNLTNANGILYFTRFDSQSGMELWKSDGSVLGTELVTNISAVGSSTPQNLTVAGNKLFFTAATDTYGRELYVIDLPIVSSSIVGSHVYHAGSSFAGGGVPNALDTSKQLAKEGPVPQELNYDNLINSSGGINGLAFDFEGLPGSLTASDSEFLMSPQGAFNQLTNPAEDWQNAPAPSAISLIAGTPSRVVLEWPNNAIANRWLRITVRANAKTGLVAPEVYYIGHLLGETTGPTGGVYTVAFADITPIRGAVGQSVNAGSIHDIDKSGTVSFADISAMRSNVGAQLTNITIAAAVGFGGAGGGADLTPMHSGTSGAVGGDEILDVWPGIMDSAGLVEVQDWLRSAVRIVTHRNGIAQSEDRLFRQRSYSLDSIKCLIMEDRAYLLADSYFGESNSRAVDTSRELLRETHGPVRLELREVDESFPGPLIKEGEHR